MKKPDSCKGCTHLGNYTECPYARNPHYCCELLWQLYNIDYRVNIEGLSDDNCPYRNKEFFNAVNEMETKLTRDGYFYE